jgi:dCTP deaminase
MILRDTTLYQMFPQLIPNELERDESMINPASIDIRVGYDIMLEQEGGWVTESLPDEGYWMAPGEFVLVNTFERIAVPNGYAVDLKLKSSTARKGFNHMLAFWVDPGWDGYLTMEIKNELSFNNLLLKPQMKFGQIVVHKLDGLAAKPYQGKYQTATTVEGVKSDDVT